MREVEMARNISPLKDLRALWQLYKVIKAEKPQIVHTHTPKAGLLGMLAACFASVPVRLHTVAGLPLLETKGIKRKLLNFIEQLTYRCAHTVYPNSFGLQEIILANKFCQLEKLKVLGNGSSNGINTDYFSPQVFADEPDFIAKKRSELGIKPSDFVYCFVGRLAKEKGVRELIDAFEALQKESSNDMKLLLVGPFEKFYGALDEDTFHKISDHPDIISVGRHDDIRPFLYISDVFTFPSYREGFPGVVLQAGAMGLASIVANINGCNEIVKDKVNGLIVEPKNTTQLKEAMLRVYQDGHLRKRLASQARVKVLEGFKQEIIWEQLLKEYNLSTANIKDN